jgi:hypothetical protein
MVLTRVVACPAIRLTIQANLRNCNCQYVGSRKLMLELTRSGVGRTAGTRAFGGGIERTDGVKRTFEAMTGGIGSVRIG